MSSKFSNRFLKPKSNFGRWSNIVLISFAALASFVSAYVINFELCQGDACDSLVASKLWVVISPFFLIYGLSAIGVALFLHQQKDLESVYSDSIAMVSTFGFFLVCGAPFTIAYELGIIS